ncbi:DUF1877 family protein, partial [Streptomyces cinereoruber]|uniref:DUF1877 family protein n=1 Tax=Streptomyces cinereoruber TaxID=67260 RepID=UPI00363D0444
EQVGVNPAAIRGDYPLPSAGDWGYGQPQVIEPDTARQVTLQLSRLDFDEAMTSIDLDSLTNQEVYALDVLTAPDMGRAYLAHHYNLLKEQFEDASTSSSGFVIWIA